MSPRCGCRLLRGARPSQPARPAPRCTVGLHPDTAPWRYTQPVSPMHSCRVNDSQPCSCQKFTQCTLFRPLCQSRWKLTHELWSWHTAAASTVSDEKETCEQICGQNLPVIPIFISGFKATGFLSRDKKLILPLCPGAARPPLTARLSTQQ